MSTDRVPWREAVVAAAERSALAVERERWGADPPFNYRLEHVRAVARIAQQLARRLGADEAVVTAAAWLHDVCKDGEPHHAQRGAEAARSILADTDFPSERIGAVYEAIARHAGLYKDYVVEPLEAAIVWDADKLSKLGATAIVHFIGYGLSPSDKLTTEDVMRRAQGVLDDWMPKTAASMNTAPAKIMARQRLAAFRGFARQLRREWLGDELSPEVTEASGG